MGEGQGGRRLRLRPRGAHAPEGEPLARRGVDKNNLAPSPFLRMFMYIIFKPILARQDQVRIVVSQSGFLMYKVSSGLFGIFLFYMENTK